MRSGGRVERLPRKEVLARLPWAVTKAIVACQLSCVLQFKQSNIEHNVDCCRQRRKKERETLIASPFSI